MRRANHKASEEEPVQTRRFTAKRTAQASASSLPFSSDTPPLPSRRRRGASGWLVGVMLGALCGLWMLPPVRYTLSSQMRFALAQDSLPWLRTFDAQRSHGEAARLDAAAALLPDDYLLQVGRATAFDTPDDAENAPPNVDHSASLPLPSRSNQSASSPAFLNPASPGQSSADTASSQTSSNQSYSNQSSSNQPSASQLASGRALIRLTKVARDFPLAPGAQAHLVRTMMAGRIRIQRPELSPSMPRLIPPRYTDVKLITWALRNGERADPDNAFWPAMLATTYFAAGRDQQALDALTLCAQKSRWDSYLYEEVLGQWRLYSLAYGDHGAAQKIGPLTLLAFPHLHELRRMAETARIEADRAAARGEVLRAIQIRRAIRLLGHILRDNATWAYEALYGTDLLLISACDSDAHPQQSSIANVHDWEQQAQGYLAFLRRSGKLSEITALYTEVDDSCRLRAQVDVAREDASFPGIPPGIPLIALFSDWMAGVSLLQQALLLSLCVVGASLWRPRPMRSPRGLRLLSRFLACLLTAAMGTLLFTTLPSSRLAVLFEISVGALFVIACRALQSLVRRKRTRTVPLRAHDTPNIGADSLNADTSGESELEDGEHFDTILDADYNVCAGVSEDELLALIAAVPDDSDPDHTISSDETRLWEHWGRGTTLRFLLVMAAGTGLLLYSLRGLFPTLHPVALLLSSMMGIAPPATGLYALQVGLLACALPLLLIVSLCLWALWRDFPIAVALVYGLRRLFLPALAALALAYLLLLNQTLRLDAEATHAINEAAKDDLHWVLTHSEGEG